MKKIRMAIVGVGYVGRNFLKVLEQRNFPLDPDAFAMFDIRTGEKKDFMGREYIIQELKEDSFDRGFDIALFGVEGNVSEKFAPIAAAKGCVAVDNSSFFRLDEDVPLVVPEVNPEDAFKHKGIIANPNCSTIQAVVALYPLYVKYGIKRIVFSTYQAVSGAGMNGIADLERTLKGEPAAYFPHQIAGNCIPHIDAFTEDGYTKEELKMINETRKIMRAPDLKITATAVRVPVYVGHSECVNAELGGPFEMSELVETLKAAPGVVVKNDFARGEYPMPLDCAGTDEVYVGRIRRDFSADNGVNLWVVADNARKGAATNAVQIAELLAGRM
ncbi:MAG: aspartate-semialdehyde dehydrogenase [Firmicutes bacterium]|nr:aspartate-semialdehyde dehydrogenase [Bacillota bacterium]